MIFEFINGIEEALANKLQNLGIIVKGDVLPNFDDKLDPDDMWETDSDDNTNETK